MSTAVPAIDEYPIRQIPDIPLWSENFALAALAALAAAQRASFFYSIGRWYADPTVWRENIAMALPAAASSARATMAGTLRRAAPGRVSPNSR